jgi:hypothetical protein
MREKFNNCVVVHRRKRPGSSSDRHGCCSTNPFLYYNLVKITFPRNRTERRKRDGLRSEIVAQARVEERKWK